MKPTFILYCLLLFSFNALASPPAELITNAKKGDIQAQSELGFYYLEQDSLEAEQTPEQLYKSAETWLKKASKAGDEDAEAGLDHAQAILAFIEQAKTGDKEALFDLASAFDDGELPSGNGIIQSYKLAFKWYQKAAKKDHPIAINNIGVMYARGQSVQESASEAVKWYERAANMDYDLAQENLAFMYANGTGVEQSDKIATEWFKKAANQGLASSQYQLGHNYFYGKGIEKSTKKGLEWIQKAVNNEDEDAQNALGVMYLRGKGVPQNQEKGIALIQKAAEQYLPEAYYNLGKHYLKQKEYEQAFEWLELASDSDIAPAMSALGRCYFEGLGIEKSHEEGIALFKRAASRNDSGGFYYMAKAYRNGLGVPRDKTTAYAWFNLAVEFAKEFKDDNFEKYQSELQEFTDELSTKEVMIANSKVNKIVFGLIDVE